MLIRMMNGKLTHNGKYMISALYEKANINGKKGT